VSLPNQNKKVLVRQFDIDWVIGDLLMLTRIIEFSSLADTQASTSDNQNFFDIRFVDLG
jgi:hypothetical protein